MHRVAAAVIVLACAAACAQPSGALFSNATPVGDLTPLDEVPSLDEDRAPGPTARDCRLGPQLRLRFGRVRVRACGALPRDTPFEAREAARACVERALLQGDSFVVEQAITGWDTAPSQAIVGIATGGRLVTYYASFDGPLGTGFEWRGGGTVIRRCRVLTLAKHPRPVVAGIELRSECERNVADCFHCQAPREVARCDFEEKP